jgi:hypothetical protein
LCDPKVLGSWSELEGRISHYTAALAANIGIKVHVAIP